MDKVIQVTGNNGTFSVDPSGTVSSSTGINLGDSTLSKYKEGTFVMRCYRISDGYDLTQSNPGLTCSYTLVGKLCIVSIPSSSGLVWPGTVSATVDFGGFPSEIDPASCKIVPIYYTLDGSNRSAGFLGWRIAGKWKLLDSNMFQVTLPGSGANNFAIDFHNNQVNPNAKVQMIYSLD